MQAKNAYRLIGVASVAAAFASAAFAGGEAGKLELRDLGAKFVGYTTRSADKGSLDVLNPLFVQYLLPARRRHEHPIVFIHGGGGQGTDWLETPDGRDGWVDYFVADGWDVYVVDRPGHGRSQSNASCGNGMVRVGNSATISQLSTSAPTVWPGGAPTPTNDAVVGWTASSTTAPYCGDALAAEKISALLDEIGPAVLLAHSAGGGSTFRVPDLNPEKVVGIIGFEAAASNPAMAGFNNSPALITAWKAEPALPATFAAVGQERLCHARRPAEPARQLCRFADRARRDGDGHLEQERDRVRRGRVAAGRRQGECRVSARSRPCGGRALRDGAARQRRLREGLHRARHGDRLGGEELEIDVDVDGSIVGLA